MDDTQKLEEKGDEKKRKQRFRMIKVRPRKLIINVSICRYPIVRKIAKYEYGMFLSGRDMFAPVNG